MTTSEALRCSLPACPSLDSARWNLCTCNSFAPRPLELATNAPSFSSCYPSRLCSVPPVPVPFLGQQLGTDHRRLGLGLPLGRWPARLRRLASGAESFLTSIGIKGKGDLGLTNWPDGNSRPCVPQYSRVCREALRHIALCLRASLSRPSLSWVNTWEQITAAPAMPPRLGHLDIAASGAGSFVITNGQGGTSRLFLSCLSLLACFGTSRHTHLPDYPSARPSPGLPNRRLAIDSAPSRFSCFRCLKHLVQWISREVNR